MNNEEKDYTRGKIQEISNYTKKIEKRKCKIEKSMKECEPTTRRNRTILITHYSPNTPKLRIKSKKKSIPDKQRCSIIIAFLSKFLIPSMKTQYLVQAKHIMPGKGS